MSRCTHCHRWLWPWQDVFCRLHVECRSELFANALRDIRCDTAPTWAKPLWERRASQ